MPILLASTEKRYGIAQYESMLYITTPCCEAKALWNSPNAETLCDACGTKHRGFSDTTYDLYGGGDLITLTSWVSGWTAIPKEDLRIQVEWP